MRFLLIFLFGFSALAAQEKIQLSIKNPLITVAPGRVETILITAELPKGFHAYSDKFKISQVRPENFVMGQIQVENEIDFYDKFTKKNRKGFTDKGSISIQLETPIDVDPSIKGISFKFHYQICSEKVCYLPESQTMLIGTYFSEFVEKKYPVVETMKDLSLIGKLQSAFRENIFYAFLIAFIAGILTSFTPCIFPMIPITISILGHDAEKNSRLENLFRSVLYVLGIAVTYSILGVLAALTGNLFGNALSNKYVLITMVLLFFTMGLSMWGLFELQVPAFIRNKFGIGTKKGFIGVFAMGLIAGVVASPCVGPVLVSILSYVSTTRSVFLGFGLLFTYAIGLGLIFIVIGVFGQALSLLPRSGQWMNKIKFFLGLLMVLMGFYYLRLAFPSFKTPTESTWQAYSEQKIAEAQTQKKPVLIDFRADWCAACIEMEEKVFSLQEFKEISEGFMLLKVDATEDTSEVQAIIKKYDVKGLPTVLFMNRNGAILNQLTFTQFIEWNELKPKMLEALTHDSK